MDEVGIVFILQSKKPQVQDGSFISSFNNYLLAVAVPDTHSEELTPVAEQAGMVPKSPRDCSGVQWMLNVGAGRSACLRASELLE